jgi:hypothetical protein
MLPDSQVIINKLQDYKKKIIDMDRMVRLYLSDRQRYPYPGYVELVKEIRAFESRLYGKRFGFANTEIELRLEGLLYSLLIFERHWKRLFEEDEMM